MAEYSSLIGRSVVVTGGSRGLGRAMVLGLLRAGARVAIVCTAASRHLDETLQQAESVAPRSRWICAFGNVARAADCERIAAEALTAFGRIDVLVNNAAARTASPAKPFWQIESEDWLRIFHTNCDSVFLMSKAAVPSMIERGFGKIINISTNNRTMAREKFTPYGPSKAFVEACTRAWARELVGTGVTANVLLPGGNVDTSVDLTGAAPSPSAALRASIMAAPILWLAADESNAYTGERFVANLWDEAIELDRRVDAARQSGAEVPVIM